MSAAQEFMNECRCMNAYLLKAAELRTEAAISRFESRRDDACEVMA